MSMPGIGELLILAVIVALLFGTKKLGSIGSDLGNAIKGFRNAMRDDDASAQKKEPSSGEIESGTPPKDDPRA